MGTPVGAVDDFVLEDLFIAGKDEQRGETAERGLEHGTDERVGQLFVGGVELWNPTLKYVNRHTAVLDQPESVPVDQSFCRR